MISARLSRIVTLPAAAALLTISGCRTTPDCPHCGGTHHTQYYVVPNGHGHAAPLPGHAPVLPDAAAPALPPGSEPVPPAPASEPPVSEPPTLSAPGNADQSSTGTRSPAITYDSTGHLTAVRREAATTEESHRQSSGPATRQGSSPNFFEQLKSGFRDMVGPAMQ